MRLITAPLSFIGEAAGIFAMGRIMRMPFFLNSLLAPRYSAGVFGTTGGRRLLQQGQRAGADLDGVSPLGLELRERVAQESRAVLASLGEQGVDSDTRQDMSNFVQDNIRQPIQQMGQVVDQQAPDMVSQAQQMNPLRRMELNKLLGITP